MNLNEMKQVLGTRAIQLTKSLGQNFLHDANQLQRIVAVAELKPTDKVLEIGPGLGPLTELLVAQAGEVLAIEKDARLVEVLRQRFRTETGGTPALRLLHDDALDYLKREPRDLSDWKMVANLPFSVASPILVELAQASRGPRRIVGTLQVEVAKRLGAEPGAPDYGVLSLLVQLNYEPQPWFKIPASCFFPEPDIDAAGICLVRREPPPLTDEERKAYVRIVKRGFSQRRKMMFKLLKGDWPEQRLAQEFERLQLSRQVRAEKVSLGQFTCLARNLQGPPPIMSAEIFDVVNERDEVIGQQPRSEVHRLGLMHRAVHVLVFNAAGQVFLQKRSMSKDRQAGLWDSSASGHVDAGEDYDACAVRELGEEIGLQLSAAPKRLFKFAACAETDQEHVWVYRCEAEGPFRLHPEEIERGGWFAPGEVTRWMAERPEDFADALLLIWKKVIRELR